MKIFSWMHSKLIAKQEVRKDTFAAANSNNTRQDSLGDEFGDWPHELLTIGTFGNSNNLKQEFNEFHQSTFVDHLQDITFEEINKLQKERAQLLDKQQVDGLLEAQNPQSGNILEHDDRSENKKDERLSRLERSTSVVLNREKDIRAQKKSSIRKKSLTFILKKMLICRSGFAPTLSLRDPISDKSRMEKILRAILHKKIYPQNSNPKATAKKYLKTKQLYTSSDSDDDKFDVKNDGCKWVNTDSDYIVLEI